MANVYLYLILYIVLLFAIAWWSSRKHKKEDFLIAGRDRGGWQIFSSKFAASIGVGYFITYTGFAYEYGYGVFTMLLGILVGYFLFAYWAVPKIYKNSTEKKFYTIGDYVSDKIKSPTIGVVANFVSIAVMFAWLLTGIIGGGKVINGFGFISYNLAVILTAFVVLVYILIAGFKGVILTDVIQAVVIGILLLVVTFGIVGTNNIGNTLASTEFGLDIGVAIAFFLFGVLAVFSNSDRYQLTYAAKTERKVKHGIGLAVIPVLLVAFLLLLIGAFMASTTPNLDSSLIFTEALKIFLSPTLLPFAIVLFFAGIMSSADTNVYGISSHFAMSRKNWSIRKIRFIAVVLMIIMSILAILFPNVVDVSILAGGISLILSFPMIYLLFGGRKRSKFLMSAIGGLVGLAIGLAIFGIEPEAALIVVILSALGLLW